MNAEMLTERDHERLERFVDDALPTDEAAAVERQIEAEPAWAEAHAELLTLRAILQDDVEAAVERADFGDFFAAIEARLPAAVEAAPSPAARPKRAKRAAHERYRDRVIAWWRRNWPPVLLGAAVAAAIAIWVTATRAPEPSPAAVPVAEKGAEGAPVVVEGIKNGGDKTVLVSQPADDEGATVIWLLDEEQVDEEQAPPKPAGGEDPI